MELAVPGAGEPGTAVALSGLSPRRMVEIYRLMYLSRCVDDREILLKRQQKIYFQISAAGHEALQVGAALAMRPGYDWFFPYYRDRALCLALGVTPDEMFLQSVGAATDPASGGRPRQAATSAAIPRPLPGPKETIEPSAMSNSTPTRSSSPRLAKVPPPRASSGRRSTPPPTRNCRSSSASKTTATPSAHPSR